MCMKSPTAYIQLYVLDNWIQPVCLHYMVMADILYISIMNFITGIRCFGIRSWCERANIHVKPPNLGVWGHATPCGKPCHDCSKTNLVHSEPNTQPLYNAPINGIPHSPTPGLDAWGNSGDLTKYHVKALPDVNTPIYRQESIGDLT